MGGIGAQRQRALILLVSAVGCAAPASEGPRRLELAPAAPTLASHRLVAEGETGPSRAELRPYIRQVPLVRIVQDGFVTYRDPSYDLAVFAHGSLFFEGEHRVAEIGFRAGRLDADTLRVLREELGKLCPVLEVGPFCTDSMSVSVACHLPSGDFSGRDHCPSGEGDRHTIDAAKTVIDSLRIGSWVASDPRGTRTYLAGDIEKTLRPIRWKRYVPIGEQSPPDAPGPARSAGRAETIAWLETELARLRQTGGNEPPEAVDWRSRDVSVLVGMSRVALEGALGDPDVCSPRDQDPCPFGPGRVAYAFFRLGRAMGGGPTLVLHFDQADVCTHAQWLVTK